MFAKAHIGKQPLPTQHFLLKILNIQGGQILSEVVSSFSNEKELISFLVNIC